MSLGLASEIGDIGHFPNHPSNQATNSTIIVAEVFSPIPPLNLTQWPRIKVHSAQLHILISTTVEMYFQALGVEFSFFKFPWVGLPPCGVWRLAFISHSCSLVQWSWIGDKSSCSSCGFGSVKPRRGKARLRRRPPTGISPLLSSAVRVMSWLLWVAEKQTLFRIF